MIPFRIVFFKRPAGRLLRPGLAGYYGPAGRGKRPYAIKGAFKKIKETCKRIWGNLDKLSLAKNTAKIGVSVATGTAPLALLNIGAEQANKILTDETARNDFISKAGALLKPSSCKFRSNKAICTEK